jgi:F5/8 type C domain-containing protein
MAAHRYWRINISAAVSGSVHQIAEIEMRTAAGGADQCSGGTVSASNSTAGFPVANVVDDLGTTSWHRSAATAWVKYDFGAGNDKDIVEVAITAWTDTNRAPKNFTVEWSDDNSAWTAAMTLSNITTWYPGERKLFNSSGETSAPSIAAACRYWRLVVTAPTATAVGVAEIQLRISAGGADQTGSGSAVNGRAVSPGHAFADAFDDNSSTYWGTPDGAGNYWHAWGHYDFGSGVTKTIVEIAIQANATASQAPTAFYLQRSEDGVGYAAADMTLTGITGWSAGQTRYFDASGETSGAPPASTVRPVVMCVC